MPATAISTHPQSRRGEHVGHIYQQLRHEIIRGVLGPGSRMVEAEIAELA